MSRWYSHKFHIERKDPASTRWWTDLFLFDTVVRDCLLAVKNDLIMWRVHRRAADDASGHRFSFIYYASPEVFKRVKSSMNNHESANIIRDSGILLDLLHNEEGLEIESTCDPSWPLSLRKSWPYYIMGVSQMALDLIENLRTSPRPALDISSIHQQELYYTQLMIKQKEVWQNWGSTAFFHHINAIFGYEPLIAQPRGFLGILASF